MNQKEKLTEATIKALIETINDGFYGYSVEDDIKNYGGPVSFDRFFQRALNAGIEDEAFEQFGSRKPTAVQKMARIRYNEYKTKFNNIPKNNSIKNELNRFISDINAKQIGRSKISKNHADIRIEFNNGVTGTLLYNNDESIINPYTLYIGHRYDNITASNLEELKQKFMEFDMNSIEK